MASNGGLVEFKEGGNGGIIEFDSQGRVKQDPRVIQADFVFTIDTTGSMDGEINGLLKTLKSLADQLQQRRIDWRIATLAFGDLTVRGDRIMITPFTAKLDIVKRSLDKIPRFDGGGNDGESSLEAMDKVLNLGTYRPNAIKVCILLTDEPALTRGLKPQDITRRFKEAGILTYVISEPYVYFKQMALETGGKWFQISSRTNFLSILDQLFKKVTQTVVDVQTVANGDVQKYLQLMSGGDVKRNV